MMNVKDCKTNAILMLIISAVLGTCSVIAFFKQGLLLCGGFFLLCFIMTFGMFFAHLADYIIASIKEEY